METRSIAQRAAGALTSPAAAVNRLSAELRGAEWDEAGPILAQLFSLPMKDGQNDDALIGAYRIAIHNQPLWVIKEVVMAFLAGKIGSGFCPNSAELGKELDRRTDAKRTELGRALRSKRELEQDERVNGFRGDADREPPARKRDETQFYAVEINGQTLFNHDEWLVLHRRRRLPAGAYWQARTGKLFLPVGTEIKPEEGQEEIAKGDGFNLFPDRDEWHRLHFNAHAARRSDREAAE